MWDISNKMGMVIKGVNVLDMYAMILKLHKGKQMYAGQSGINRRTHTQ